MTTMTLWLATRLQLLLLVAALASGAAILPPPSRETPEFWLKAAKDDLKTAKNLYSSVNVNRGAKSAILFLGDGMGIPTVTAGRILKGQLAGTAGEEATLNFERFPHTALVKTYNTDMQTPDSAGTATAFLCGVKARTGTLGVNQLVGTRNCSAYNSRQHDVQSFLHEALAEGKSVGIVTTTRVTHATPGAAYSHTAYREWEDDTDRNVDVPEDLRSNCPDIAQQLVTNTERFSVVFGGGRRKFLPRSKNGTRTDGQDLTEKWRQYSERHAYIRSREELLRLQPGTFDSVLGLFSDSHMSYDFDNDRAPESQRQPSLSEMTAKAIEILKRNERGFALLVEGGRIDHGHHDNRAKMALYDMVAMDKAIGVAMEATDASDTLLLVTADHSHVFSVGGWADRGNPILGKVRHSYYNNYDANGDALGDDKMPYTSIFYGDGPAAPPSGGGRRNLTGVDTTADDFKQSAIVPVNIESHGSEDVAIYARGPGAHLLHSTHEQSYVANLVKHSICVGQFKRDGDCLGAGGFVASAALVSALSAIASLAGRL